MTTNIVLLQKPNIIQVESKLYRMQELKQEIKVLEAETKMLKDELIKEYFLTNESYKTSKGLELATYKAYSMNKFQQTEFKEAHREMYDSYCKEVFECRFLLK